MIIKVHKLLIYGVKEEVSAFFEKAQEKGYLEFIGSSKVREFPPFLKNYLNAIKILKQFQVAEISLDKLSLKTDTVCDKIVQITNNIEHLEDIKHSLIEEAKTIGPFGDFSMEDIEFIEEEGKRLFQFFVIKSSKQKKVERPKDLIHVAREYDLDYFVAINKEKEKYPGFIEVSLNKPASILKKRIAAIDVQMAKYRDRLKDLSVYLPSLKTALLDKLNAYNLAVAKNNTKTRLEEKIFSIEAWIAENKIQNLKELIQNAAIDYEIIAVEKTDRIPTIMENKGFAAVGEDLVKIYEIPNVEEKDPSLWIIIFFSLFFAMIVSDAGYGLIFLAISFLLKYKVKNPNPLNKRLIKYSIYLSTCCIIWGILCTSYFGINISPTNKLQKVSIINYLSKKKAEFHLNKKDDVYQSFVKKYPPLASAKNGEDFLTLASKDNNFEAQKDFNRNVLLELSLLVGCLHIITAFLRNFKKNLSGIGWIVFIIGGYLYFPSFIQSPTMVNYLNILSENIAYKIGYFIIFSGMGLAVLLAIYQHHLWGIKEISTVSAVFGDILSYLRIYALALAGSILSGTFNEMAGSFNIIIGIFIILFGHLTNISMTVMGAVIHGLRLNFLEWYNHCFEGGGKIFNPLRLFK